MLGGCLGEGVNIGVNLSEPGDEEGKTGADTGDTGQHEGITPGEGTTAEEEQGQDELARNIAGHANIHFEGTVEDTSHVIEGVIESPDSMRRNLKNGRVAYYKDGVIVIKNPNVSYGGTAYKGSFNDFLKLR